MEISNELSTQNTPVALIIPYWLTNTIKLNKLSHKDLLNIDKLKDNISIEDLISLVHMQLYMCQLLPTVNYIDIIKKCTDEEYKNYVLNNVKIAPKNSIRNFFNECITNESDETSSQCYRLLQTDSTQFNSYVFTVTIEPSFFNSLECRDIALAFISDCLKIYYSYNPIKQVSEIMLFKHYLNLLNSKVPFSPLLT